MELIMKAVMIVLSIGVSIIIALLVFKIRKRSGDNNAALKAALEQTRNRKEKLRNISQKVFKNRDDRYRKLQIYLSKKGVNFMMKRTVDPIEFIGIKLLCGVFTGVVAYLFGGIFAFIIVGVAAYYLPDLIIYMNNRYDNKAMLLDVKEIYEILKLKTESGLFLTDSLFQCFKVAQNGRLKAGLLELTSEIKAKNNISDALKKFELKFDNKYITSFAGVIRQGLETGDSLSSIENISKQLVAVQKATDVETDAKTSANVQITQILILLEVFVIIFYALFKFASTIDIPM